MKRADFPALALGAFAFLAIVIGTMCYGRNEDAKAIFWLLMAGGFSLSAANMQRIRRSEEIKALLTEIKSLLEQGRRN